MEGILREARRSSCEKRLDLGNLSSLLREQDLQPAATPYTQCAIGVAEAFNALTTAVLASSPDEVGAAIFGCWESGHIDR